jgi:hypothetical protein
LIDLYTNATTSERIIHTILIKVDWIRFAFDYNQLSGGRKSTWLKQGFMRARQEEFVDLDETDTKEKLVELQDDFKKWKKQAGNDTTARNRLYELFLHVNFSFDLPSLHTHR